MRELRIKFVSDKQGFDVFDTYRAIRYGFLRLNKRSKPDLRFFASFLKHQNGCWIWRKPFNKQGYGKIKIGQKYHFAHRYSWFLHYGPIPTGFFVLHKCDNPSCVNPAHLFLGTHVENMKDMRLKERQCRGVEKPKAKLTPESVRKIRKLFVPSSRRFGASALGRMFGVSNTVVKMVIKGRIWKHIQE